MSSGFSTARAARPTAQAPNLPERLGRFPFSWGWSAQGPADTFEAVSFAAGDSFTPAADLSTRERQVLELAANGLTNHQVALRLGVSVHAIKFHLASIYRKLHVANRTEAAAYFFMSRSLPRDDTSLLDITPPTQD